MKTVREHIGRAFLAKICVCTAVLHAGVLGVAIAHEPEIPVTHPTLKAFLLSWNWRPDVIGIVATLGAVYALGWWRLWKQGARVARKWQLALYLTALVATSLALLSPIDTYGSFLFFMHMIQHELLMMVAVPLLLLADPLPVILWGLPRNLRRGIGHLLIRGAFFRRVLRALTWMPASWLLYVITLWVWHYPPMYQASLQNEFVHDAEHLSFFLTAILFWWPIVNPAPRVHGYISYGFRIAYVVLAALQNTLLAALIALTERVLYPYYVTTPRLWGLTPLGDQITGGLIMWIPGGMMYVITALVLVARMLDHEVQITRQREAMA
ncbi:MAG: cytochrome c oxidase assembly protein [Dehalococcoidia bacterium]